MIGPGARRPVRDLGALDHPRGHADRQLDGRAHGEAAVALLFPLIGISAGWIFTEMGRQPWIVYGLMKTEGGVSPR